MERRVGHANNYYERQPRVHICSSWKTVACVYPFDRLMVWSCVINIVRAKKQQWSATLCHSLVPHTYVDL